MSEQQYFDNHPWTYNGFRYTDEQVAVCPTTDFTFAPRDGRQSSDDCKRGR